jgi:hypothetical protein
MKKSFVFQLLIAVALLASTSCSKEEEPQSTYKKPTIADRGNVVEIPTALQNSSDPNAQMAATWMGMANGISQFASSFTIPENAQTGNAKSSGNVYFWTYGGYSYWMTFSELADKYVWKYEYAFPGTSRFTFIEAQELKTGMQGSWAIYDPEGTHETIWDYNWNINSTNDFYSEMMWYGYSNNDDIKFEVMDRANNSGYFKMYIGAVKHVEVIWNTNGSGTWWYSFDGETAQGSWL